MGESVHASSETKGAVPRPFWRAPFFFILVLLAVGFILALEVSTWAELNRLKSVRGSAPAGSRAAELRESLAELNNALLVFHLGSKEESWRQKQDAAIQSTVQILSAIQAEARTAASQDLAAKLSGAFAEYQQFISGTLDERSGGVRKNTALRLQEEITTASRPVLELCGQLEASEKSALALAVAQGQKAASRLQRSLVISFFLLIALSAGMAWMTDRARVGPLRSQLSASRQAFERQERLASLGALAAGVAHEIRNPLTAIKLRLFSLKKELPSGAANNEDLRLIGNEISRLEKIVHSFLEFARPPSPAKTRFPAAELLQAVKNLLRPQLEKDQIELALEAEDGLELHADKQQLQQVFINLVRNSAESIGRNGTIQLRARSAVGSWNKRATPVAVLEVADTGPGIPPEVEQKIFDPFFSTKDAGTGMGLSIAARIVENHGGMIQCSSRAGKGATFSITLPRESNDSGPNTHHRG